MSFNTNVTKFKEILSSSSEKIKEFVKNFSTILIRILDKIVNGFTTKEKDGSLQHKYYTYFISIVLITILCLFYYLNEKQNLFTIKNTKYEILVALLLIGFSIYCFLFFAYRNHTNWNEPTNKDPDNYNSDLEYSKIYKSRNIINNNTDTAATINKENFKATLTKPLFNIMKYIFYLLLLISIPLFILNYTFYLHKVNDNIFNITKNILLLLIVLIVLAIIAKLFSIKTSSESIYCEITKTKDGKANYTDLIKSYAKYFLCIFKNFIFFIPCLIVILTDEINRDIRLTPSPVYILFFILLLLITLIFLLPILFKFIRTFNKSDILQGSGPFYLNQEKTLGKYQNLNTHLSKAITVPNITQQENTKPSEDKLDKIMGAFNINKDEYKEQLNKVNSSIGIINSNSSDSRVIKDTSANSSDIKAHSFTLFNDINSAFNIKSEYYNSVISKEKFPYNYTYSVSFYIYLNPQPENTSLAYTKDTVLFNYGFKPVIFYNGKSQKIIIKSRTISNRGDQLDTIYEMTNPKFQKWLFFVINYDNNLIDVFIDGKLVGSKENVSPYFKGDNITIGEKDGIHGSIKEIYYYDKITTPSTIELLYNLSKNNK
jgi:hypothetical protein